MSGQQTDHTQQVADAGHTVVPAISRIDHIHVFVVDRSRACRWYEDTLGLTPVEAFASWAADDGPLTVGNADGSVHLALFERPAERPAVPNRATIALGVSGPELLRWHAHLQNVLGKSIALVDHQLSWSLYFSDPDANPFEITSTEVESVKRLLAG